MNTWQAVPVWLKVSSDWAMGAEWVTEEKQVDGILRLGSAGLVLEFEVVLSTTTMGSDFVTDTEDLGRHELEIPFDRLVSITLHRRWWLPRLRVQTNRLSSFEGLPGAKRGVVALRIKRSNVDAARTLIDELEFSRADLELRRATQLDVGDLGSLHVGGPEDGS